MNRTNAIEWCIKNVNHWPRKHKGIATPPKGWVWTYIGGEMLLFKLMNIPICKDDWACVNGNQNKEKKIDWIDKIKNLKNAVQAYEDLAIEIKKAGMPPHTDFWRQSIHEKEESIKAAYEQVFDD